MSKETKLRIINSAKKAIDELIKIGGEPILSGGLEDPEPEKLKQAAATKKLAIFDAFEILSRIEQEEQLLNDESADTPQKNFRGFAEGRSK